MTTYLEDRTSPEDRGLGLVIAAPVCCCIGALVYGGIIWAIAERPAVLWYRLVGVLVLVALVGWVWAHVRMRFR